MKSKLTYPVMPGWRLKRCYLCYQNKVPVTVWEWKFKVIFIRLIPKAVLLWMQHVLLLEETDKAFHSSIHSFTPINVCVRICFKGLSVFLCSNNRLNNLNAPKNRRPWHFRYLLWYVFFSRHLSYLKRDLCRCLSALQKCESLTSSVCLVHTEAGLMFPSCYKSLPKKNESKMSKYHFHRVSLLPAASEAGQRVCLCYPSLCRRPISREAMLEDSSQLPKCGSASLIFRWLFLFGEMGLKTEQPVFLLTALYHLLESRPSIPICEPPYYRTNLCVTAPHGYLYTPERTDGWISDVLPKSLLGCFHF